MRVPAKPLAGSEKGEMSNSTHAFARLNLQRNGPLTPHKHLALKRKEEFPYTSQIVLHNALHTQASLIMSLSGQEHNTPAGELP